MKILSVGNSFSEDAQRYLHDIAAANGKKLTCANLYIGGCSLKQHYANLTADEKAYDFQFNGESTHLKVSIKDAVKSNAWDCITLQQASHESFDIKTYSPYIEEIAKRLRLSCPETKILLHQTWAYPQEKERLSQMGFATTAQMFDAVEVAYGEAEKRIGADGMIKSGAAMLAAYRLYPDMVYRDAIHASFGFGRYLLGCVWYKALFGDFPAVLPACSDEPIEKEQLRILRDCVR